MMLYEVRSTYSPNDSTHLRSSLDSSTSRGMAMCRLKREEGARLTTEDSCGQLPTSLPKLESSIASIVRVYFTIERNRPLDYAVEIRRRSTARST